MKEDQVGNKKKKKRSSLVKDKYLDLLLDLGLDKDLDIDLPYLLYGEGEREYLNKCSNIHNK